MLSPSLASPSASLASPVASFSVAACDLLPVLKAAEAFRKSRSYGITEDKLFFSPDGCGLMVQAFAGKEAFAAWLPAELSPGSSFALPFLPLAAFVKTTKGKGLLSFNGKTITSDSGSLSLSADASFELSEADKLFADAYSLPAFLKREGLPQGFPLAPLFCLKGFASKDACKLVLNGFGFSEKSFCATDGFSLRESPADLPAFWQADGFPEKAWLPLWLLSLLEACTIKKEREGILGFWHDEKEVSFLRFTIGRFSSVYVALRFAKQEAAFPNYRQLFPAQKWELSTDREAFLKALSPLLSALKGSEGSPFVRLTTDGAIGELALSVEIMRDTGKGKKYFPELETVGSQEASVRASFRAFPASPMLSDAFWQKPEADQEAEREAHGKESSFLVNAFFLERILKSFSGDRIELFWTRSNAPVTFAESRQRALLMPVQTR